MTRDRFDELGRMASHVARRLAGREHHDDLVAVAVAEVWRTDTPYPWWTMRSAMVDHLRVWTHERRGHGRLAPAFVELSDDLLFPGPGPDEVVESRDAVTTCRAALARVFDERTVAALTCQADDVPIAAVAARYGVTPSYLSQLRLVAQRRLRASGTLADDVLGQLTA